MVKKKHTKTSPQNKVTPNSSFKKNKSQDYLSINEQSLPELFQALIQKDIDRLNRLLDTRPTSYIGVKDRKNRTCLHYAGYLGYSEILESLLERSHCGIAINVKDDTGKTPLFKAVESNALSCMRLLLNSKECVVNCQDENGITPLHVATLAAKQSTLQVLLEHKTDPNIKDKLGFTPLHLASSLGLVKEAECLLEHGADPNAKDTKGRTPLFAACTEKNMEVIEILLESGADENILDYRGRTAALPSQSMQFLTSLKKRRTEEQTHNNALSPVIESKDESVKSAPIEPEVSTIFEVSLENEVTPVQAGSSIETTTTIYNSSKDSSKMKNQTGREHAIWESLLGSEETDGKQNNHNTSGVKECEGFHQTDATIYNNNTKSDTAKEQKFDGIGMEDTTVCSTETNETNVEEAVVNDQPVDCSGQHQSMSEDRYSFLCHKNRELLCKKIQHCEQLEQELLKCCESKIAEKEKEISSNTSICNSMLEENNALRTEMNVLIQQNARLNDELTDYKHQLVLQKKAKTHVAPIQGDNACTNLAGNRIEDISEHSDDGADSFNSDLISSSSNKLLNKSLDNALNVCGDIDSDFQETINKLLRENVLMKKAYKEFEEIYDANTKQLEDAEQQIQEFNHREYKQRVERNQLMDKMRELETEYDELKRKYNALQGMFNELGHQNYLLKQQLRLDGHFGETPWNQMFWDHTDDEDASNTATLDISLLRKLPPKPPQASKHPTVDGQKPPRPKSPVISAQVDTVNEQLHFPNGKEDHRVGKKK